MADNPNPPIVVTPGPYSFRMIDRGGVGTGPYAPVSVIDIGGQAGEQLVVGSMPVSQNDAAVLRDYDMLSQLASCIDPNGGGLRVWLDNLRSGGQTLGTVTTVGTVNAITSLNAFNGIDSLQAGVYQWIMDAWCNSVRNRIT